MTILHLLSTQYLCVKMPIGQWIVKLISALYTLGATTYDIRTEGGVGRIKKYLKFADKKCKILRIRGGVKISGRRIWKAHCALSKFAKYLMHFLLYLFRPSLQIATQLAVFARSL